MAKPPDPTILIAQTRADWYLLWYFGLLVLIPPKLESVVIVLAPLLLVMFLILPPLISNKGERSAWRRPWAIALVLGCWTLIGTLWIQGQKEPWSPDFAAQPLPANVIHASDGPVYEGAQLFRDHGCEYCHQVSGYGGRRGPDLTYVRDRLSPDQMTIRIVNGGVNMPAFGGIVSADDLTKILSFFDTRTSHSPDGTLQ